MNLLENGYDSFRKAILKYNALDSTSPNYEFELKDIVIYVHHSTEVLMKYIISKHSELLIYNDIEKYCNYKLGLTDKESNNTIQFLDAVKRYYSIAKYPVDVKRIEYFKLLNEVRNAITHYNYNFVDSDIDHILAIVIPQVYTAFVLDIPEFKLMYINDKIEEQIRMIEFDERELLFNTFFGLIEKLSNAIKVLEGHSLDMSGINESYKMKQKKTKYDICPICRHETFLRKGSIIHHTSRVVYFGKCNCCGIDLDRNELFLFNRLHTFSPLDNSTTESLFHQDETQVNPFIELLANENIGKVNSVFKQVDLNHAIIHFIEQYYSADQNISDENIEKLRRIYSDPHMNWSIEHRLGKVIRNDIYEVAYEYNNNFETLKRDENGWIIIDHLTNEGTEYIRDLIFGYLLLDPNAIKSIDGFKDMNLWGPDQIEICYILNVKDFL